MRERSLESGRGQNQEAYQKENSKMSKGKPPLFDLTNKQDELAQRARKHRDNYTSENKRHLEGVETITRTGETNQGVTVWNISVIFYISS